MKKLGIALIMILLIAAIPDDIMAGTQDRLRDGSCRDNTTGAPLDGGILTILGAAGIAYYVSRKKKAKAE